MSPTTHSLTDVPFSAMQPLSPNAVRTVEVPNSESERGPHDTLRDVVTDAAFDAVHTAKLCQGVPSPVNPYVESNAERTAGILNYEAEGSPHDMLRAVALDTAQDAVRTAIFLKACSPPPGQRP